ncbi:MAG: M23 family metallopeptidase, partial [Rhodothermia bacterium]|nr:M23 family metallopeptidase [Rhodothermia bacterium]
ALQTVSYSQLSIVAEEHKRQLEEIPAILPADGPVVSGYGMRRHPILKIVRPHRGVDILVHEGSDVVTPGDGIVKEVGRGGGLGRYVRISHPSVGYVSTFAHLSDVPDGIKRGRRVKRGDVIGFSGNTGLSKAPHLHYEVRDESGKSYNPIYFFAPSMTPAQYEKLLAESQKGEVSLD